MDNAIKSFINMTEGESTDLNPKAASPLKYPLLYLEKVTNVELRAWVREQVLFHTKLSDVDFPFYWKRSENDWKFLGYVRLCPTTFRKLSYLRDRKIKFVKSEGEEELLEDRIVMLFLLGE